jgi:hypothetical protein
MLLKSPKPFRLLASGFVVLAVGCGSSQPASQQVLTPLGAASSNPSTRADEVRSLECSAIVAVINRSAESIERIGDGGAEMSALDLATMATMLERAALDTSQVVLTLPGLQQRAAQYKEMATRGAAAARALAAVIESRDTGRIESANDALQRAVEPEDRIIEAINVFCQAP